MPHLHLDNGLEMCVLNQISPLKKRTKQPFQRPTNSELATTTTRECRLQKWWLPMTKRWAFGPARPPSFRPRPYL